MAAFTPGLQDPGTNETLLGGRAGGEGTRTTTKSSEEGEEEEE